MFICSVNGLIKLLQLNMLTCFYTIQNVVSITCSSRASSAYFSQLLGIVYPESQSNVIKPTSKGMRRTETDFSVRRIPFEVDLITFDCDSG